MIPIRKTVRVLLLNPDKKLLLMYRDSVEVLIRNGVTHNTFWFTVGGKIEENETIEQAIFREVYEETGIEQSKISIGSAVWYEQVEVTGRGTTTILEQLFVIAHTQETALHLDNITQEEKAIIKQLKWFSIEEIDASNETIFPDNLSFHLRDIIAGNYPEKPMRIGKIINHSR